MTYKKSGVDTDQADKWVEGIQSKLHATSELVSGVGDYAAVYKLNDNEWVATSCDGIGTKILWTLQGLGSAKNLAQDLIAMNVNDVLCTGANPKLFLDYIACSGKEALQDDGFLKKFIGGIIDVCKENGQILAGGETAQMPDLYKGEEFDTAGFSVGFLHPDEYLHPSKLTPGLEIWGWPSSGPHSNGFTWLRQLFDSKKDADLIRKHFMNPTKIYVNEFKQLRAELKSKTRSKSSDGILAAYHITGSGLLNLLRSQSSVGFELNEWPEKLPAWFEAIRERSKSTYEELFKTFNGGFGFMIALSAAEETTSILKKNGLVKLGLTTESYEVNIPQFDIRLS
jgi:phosphoribosylformylglycinamidine cyclo-ligase